MKAIVFAIIFLCQIPNIFAMNCPCQRKEVKKHEIKSNKDGLESNEQTLDRHSLENELKSGIDRKYTYSMIFVTISYANSVSSVKSVTLSKGIRVLHIGIQPTLIFKSLNYVPILKLFFSGIISIYKTISSKNFKRTKNKGLPVHFVDVNKDFKKWLKLN